MNTLMKHIVALGLALSAASACAVTNDDVFAYAAANYSALFAGTPSAGQYQQYNYRYYPNTQSYLAVGTDGVIYMLAPYTNGVITAVGPLSDFSDAITAWKNKQAANNAAPVASAGTSRNVTTGTSVSLDGSGSSDADGDSLSYAWSLTSKPGGSTATLANATTAQPAFTADLAGSYVASLTVSDGKTNSTASTVTITAIPALQALDLSGNVTTGDVYTSSVLGQKTYRFTSLLGVAAANDGSLYVVEPSHDAIKLVDRNKLITTFAGTVDTFGYGVEGSQNGIGTAASFKAPEFIVIDPANIDLYVTDSGNCTIRRIGVLTGEVKTFAGDPYCGFRDEIGLGALFRGPSGITVSPDGEWLYVSDTGNNAIRKIEIATHRVTTIAGGGPADWKDGTGSSAQFNAPAGITTDGINLYVADSGNNAIRQIDIATGEVTTLAGSPGNTGSNNGTGMQAQFWYPASVLTDGKYVYVADSGNNAIRKIDIATHAVTTLAGQVSTFDSQGSTVHAGNTDGYGTSAQFNNPTNLEFQWSLDGSHIVGLIVSDTGNGLLRYIY